MKPFLKLLLLTLLGCSIYKQGVFLEEMKTRPILHLKGNILTITTTNSIKNSALFMNKIHVSVQENKKTIFISAEQAADKPFKDNFLVNLSDCKIDAAMNYSYYWLDPDKKTTRLELSE